MNAKLDRKKFRQFLHENFNISDDVIMDRIFKYFNKNSTDDIDHEEWVVGFNIFLKGIATLGFWLRQKLKVSECLSICMLQVALKVS